MNERYLTPLAVVLLVMTACDVGAPATQIATATPPTEAPSPTATRPAHGGVRDQYAAWSPDGASIAFVTNPGGGGRIWTVRVDDPAQSEETVSAVAVHPAWSPDGGRLAFTSARQGNWDIYVKDLKTGAESRMTTDGRPDYAPAWSADGAQIAFYRFDESTRRGSIMAAAADGTGERLLAAEGNEGMPQWSPDGTSIAFQSDRDGNWEIYVMRSDGSDQRRLTSTPDRHEGEPAWSPDGAWIVFSAGQGKTRDIYAIRPDGSDERRLTDLRLEVWSPRLSPDGKRLAFFEFPPGRLYLSAADGSSARTLFGY